MLLLGGLPWPSRFACRLWPTWGSPKTGQLHLAKWDPNQFQAKHTKAIQLVLVAHNMGFQMILIKASKADKAWLKMCGSAVYLFAGLLSTCQDFLAVCGVTNAAMEQDRWISTLNLSGLLMDGSVGRSPSGWRKEPVQFPESLARLCCGCWLAESHSTCVNYMNYMNCYMNIRRLKLMLLGPGNSSCSLKKNDASLLHGHFCGKPHRNGTALSHRLARLIWTRQCQQSTAVCLPYLVSKLCATRQTNYSISWWMYLHTAHRCSCQARIDWAKTGLEALLESWVYLDHLQGPR